MIGSQVNGDELENDFGGSGRGLTQMLSRHFPGGTEGNHEKLKSG
jgi:hypothetical protein